MTSTVSFEDSSDRNAGIEDTKPRRSLYYGISLQWEVYIEKIFTNFSLLLHLFDWTHDRNSRAENCSGRCWSQPDIDKCLLPHGNGSDGHGTNVMPCW